MADSNTDPKPGEDPKPGDNPKMFSQEDVNRIMADNKKGLQKQNTVYEGQIGTLTTQVSDLKDLIGKFAPAGDPGDDDPEGGDPGDAGLTDIEKMEKRFKYDQKVSDKKFTALEKRLKDADDKVISTEKRRLVAEKDRFLDEALLKSHCHDLGMAKRMFREQMTYDAQNESWVFTTKDGVEMTPLEGVDADLPDYLRSARTQGGAGGKSPRAVLESNITRQEEVLKSVKAVAHSSGGDSHLVRVLQEERKLKELKSELSAK